MGTVTFCALVVCASTLQEQRLPTPTAGVEVHVWYDELDSPCRQLECDALGSILATCEDLTRVTLVHEGEGSGGARVVCKERNVPIELATEWIDSVGSRFVLERGGHPDAVLQDRSQPLRWSANPEGAPRGMFGVFASEPGCGPHAYVALAPPHQSALFEAGPPDDPWYSLNGSFLVCTPGTLSALDTWIPFRAGSALRFHGDGALLLQEDSQAVFTPHAVCVAADGAIYVGDGPRILRLVPAGEVLPPVVHCYEVVDGAEEPYGDLLDALVSPSIAARNRATRILAEDQSEGCFEALRSLTAHSNFRMVARALWPLAHHGERGAAFVEQLQHHFHPELRLTALRALRSVGALERRHQQLALRDSSAAVRIDALQDPGLTTSDWLAVVMRYEGQDPRYVAALRFSASELLKDDPRLLGGVVEFYRSATSDLQQERWMEVLAGIATPDQIPLFLEWIGREDIESTQKLEYVDAIAILNDPRAAQAMLELTRNADELVAGWAKRWFEHRRSAGWAQFELGD